MSQDPQDVPGHGRPGGVDDPVSDAEYGDIDFVPEEKQEVYEERVEHATNILEDMDVVADIIHDQRHNDEHEFMVALEPEDESWLNLRAVRQHLNYHVIEGEVKQVMRKTKKGHVIVKVVVWLPNTEAP